MIIFAIDLCFLFCYSNELFLFGSFNFLLYKYFKPRISVLDGKTEKRKKLFKKKGNTKPMKYYKKFPVKIHRLCEFSTSCDTLSDVFLYPILAKYPILFKLLFRKNKNTSFSSYYFVCHQFTVFFFKSITRNNFNSIFSNETSK